MQFVPQKGVLQHTDKFEWSWLIDDINILCLFWWTGMWCIQKSVCWILLIAWVMCLVFVWFGRNWKCSFLGKSTTCYVYWDNVNLGYPTLNKNVQVSFSKDSLGCIWLLAEITRKLIKVRVFMGLDIIKSSCRGTSVF